MEHSEPFNDIAAAFVAAQVKIEGAVKDRNNPHFGQQYATLAAVMGACKDALNAEGNRQSCRRRPAPTGPW